ncbi:MAG: hypothetical protein KKB30_03475 [Proteobacteria bacterium]|nr:hypothetical protein [Pseudomonadota bacterium]MBU1715053.1 hypothetical protein [Pseudomonadota bacterium]
MESSRLLPVKPFRLFRIWLLTALALLCLPVISGSVDANRFGSYIERHANGWIDWQEGLIYGIGRGYLDKNNNSRPRAQGAANVLASASILKLAAGVHLDERETLETLGKGRVVIQLKAFMRDRQHKSSFIDDVKEPYFEVINVASMKGISGLTARLLTHLKDQDPEWKDFPIPTGPRQSEFTPNDEDQPWLVLDARNLPDNQQVQPSIFPKVVNENGEAIYSLQEVEEAALLNRGMMRYVVSDESPEDLRSGPDSIERIMARAQIWPVSEAMAATEKREKRRKYIVQEVKQVQGLAKTNLLVSAADARELKAEDVSSQILKKCRVIVVVSSPVGGIEGGLGQKLAML